MEWNNCQFSLVGLRVYWIMDIEIMNYSKSILF